jgi:capsular polysaccharide biosynthesis protein
MIGPHGSAFHNARFAGYGTLVVEFMPKKRFQVCFWEQARLLDQQYISYMAESLNYQNDMQIDGMQELMGLVDQKLGKYEKGENLDVHYGWRQEL